MKEDRGRCLISSHWAFPIVFRGQLSLDDGMVQQLLLGFIDHETQELGRAILVPGTNLASQLNHNPFFRWAAISDGVRRLTGRLGGRVPVAAMIGLWGWGRLYVIDGLPALHFSSPTWPGQPPHGDHLVARCITPFEYPLGAQKGSSSSGFLGTGLPFEMRGIQIHLGIAPRWIVASA